MELKILKEENNKLVLEIFEDTHTFLQLLKEYLLKNGAKFVGYYKDHPENKSVIFYIEGDNPKEILKKAKESIINDFSKLKEEVENLDLN
jgi:DNA-directed RNA polymerase subunit L